MLNFLEVSVDSVFSINLCFSWVSLSEGKEEAGDEFPAKAPILLRPLTGHLPPDSARLRP